MNAMTAAAWRDANRDVLTAATTETTARVAAVAAGRDPHGDPAVIAAAAQRAARVAALDGSDCISVLADGFGLTPFETELLVLAVSNELDASLRRSCAELAGRSSDAAAPVTFAVATRLLDGSHWSAIGPGRPLRGAGLVELGPGPLPDAPITAAERVVHHVMGCGQLDAELARTATAVLPGPAVTSAQQALAEQIVAAWSDPAAPLVQLAGRRAADCRDVAALAASSIGALAYRIRASDLPADPAARADLARRWRREMVLAATVLVVEADADHDRGFELAGFLDHVGGPLAVIGTSPLSETVAPWRRIEVPVPGGDEARQLWQRHLGTKARALRAHVDRAAEQFRLGSGEIAEVAAEVVAANGSAARALWDGCRQRTRPALDGLVERVVSAATWDDLVLPAAETETLRAIVAHAEHRAAVARAWGTPLGARGSAITAMFHGPSGTGKTLAGEVVANALGLDLYRIDLSAVVSKWIGETEKHLRAIFDAADDGGVVLLFDEADALFGKRTEVRDAHDRYANLEVSYLLERMERFKGLAILATNRRKDLDEAFLRRLRYIVEFPLPGVAEREAIWRRVIPAGVDPSPLDIPYLARAFPLAGGHIRSIMFNACLQSAGQRIQATSTPGLTAGRRRGAQRGGSAVAGPRPALSMEPVLGAVKREYDKLKRSVTLEQFGSYAPLVEGLDRA